MSSTIENIVPTLEQSKALAPYWGNRETVFLWVETCDFEAGIFDLQKYSIFKDKFFPHETFPAPTMQELWEALPSVLDSVYWRTLTGKCLYYENEDYDRVLAAFMISPNIVGGLIDAFIAIHKAGKIQ